MQQEYFTFQSNEKEEKIIQMRQMMRKMYTYEQSKSTSKHEIKTTERSDRMKRQKSEGKSPNFSLAKTKTDEKK